MQFSWKSTCKTLVHALGFALLVLNGLLINGMLSGPQALSTVFLLASLIAWIPLTIASKRWFEKKRWSSVYALGNLFLIFLALTWMDASIVIWDRELLFLGLAIGLALSLPAEWYFKKVPSAAWFALRLCLLLAGHTLTLFIYAAAFN